LAGTDYAPCLLGTSQTCDAEMLKRAKNEQNRLKQLIEDGWTVDLSYNDKQIL
jgi:hypothetical protein